MDNLLQFDDGILRLKCWRYLCHEVLKQYFETIIMIKTKIYVNFFVLNIVAAEIVDRVKKSELPPFRPAIPPDACDKKWLQLLNFCWDEDPNQRKSFAFLRGNVKKFGK